MLEPAQEVTGEQPSELGSLPPKLLLQVLRDLGISQETLPPSTGPEEWRNERGLAARQPVTGGAEGIDLLLPGTTLPHSHSLLLHPALAPGPRSEGSFKTAGPAVTSSSLNALNLAASTIALQNRALDRASCYGSVDSPLPGLSSQPVAKEFRTSPSTRGHLRSPSPQRLLSNPAARLHPRPSPVQGDLRRHFAQGVAGATTQRKASVAEDVAPCSRPRMASGHESSVMKLQEVLMNRPVDASAAQETPDLGSLYSLLLQSGALGERGLTGGIQHSSSTPNLWGAQQQVDERVHSRVRLGVPQVGPLSMLAAHSILTDESLGISPGNAPTEDAPGGLARRMAVRRSVGASLLSTTSLQNDPSCGPLSFHVGSESLGNDPVAAKGEPWTPQVQATSSVPMLSEPAAEGGVRGEELALPVFGSSGAGAESDSLWLDTLGLDFSALPGEAGGNKGEEREELEGDLAPADEDEGNNGGIKRRSAVEKKRRKRIR